MTGVLVALAGPPAVAALSPWLAGREPTAVASLIGQGALWSIALVVLGIVVFWERRPLASVGWIGFTAPSAVWGLVAAAVLLYVATPLGVWLVDVLGLAGFDEGLSRLSPLPAAVLAGGALTAGVVEEFLYRGYAIERLASLTGSRAVAALLSLAAFSLAHLPFWGASGALLTLAAGLVFTALYLWRRDLAANIVAHGLTALIQLSAVART